MKDGRDGRDDKEKTMMKREREIDELRK